MDIKQYNLIGKGGSANVYSGEVIVGNKKTAVAIKRPKSPEIQLIREFKNAMHLKEILLHGPYQHILDHFCIPMFMTDDNAIVYPLLDGYEFKFEKDPLILLKTYESISSILRILLENGISHGDIMKDNIIIIKGVPVLIDFDNMDFSGSKASIATDVDGYMELIRGKLYLLENEEIKKTLRFIIQRLDNMYNIHLKKSYFSLIFVLDLFDEISKYIKRLRT